MHTGREASTDHPRRPKHPADEALGDTAYLDALIENFGVEVRFRQQAPVEPVATDLREIVERGTRRDRDPRQRSR